MMGEAASNQSLPDPVLLRDRVLHARTPLGAVARLLSSFPRRGREALSAILPPSLQNWTRESGPPTGETLMELARALLSTRGEASGAAIAQDLVGLYAAASEGEKEDFFARLGNRLGPDRAALETAWARYVAEGDSRLPQLAKAIEAPRQELFRRLNLAPGGTGALVRMRADLLKLMRSGDPTLRLVDADLCHVLQSWFNRGFLIMKPITWSSPARLLESVIRFEAVHHIRDWDDLRGRLDPPDRRCYAFFHPTMPDDLLIFVEVALTSGLAGSIQQILAAERTPLAADDADTAIFYSISNCQEGLKGISFGHFLIKQVAMDLQRELPGLARFATLSPIPGFRSWLDSRRDAGLAEVPGNPGEAEAAEMVRLAADYLVNAKTPGGQPLDPVARFHLGNGARLERIIARADSSPKGMRESAGLMVNYLYDLPAIEQNHEAYANAGTLAVAREIRRLARGEPKPRRG